jgi:hypothetical protein
MLDEREAVDLLLIEKFAIAQPAAGREANPERARLATVESRG